MEAVPKQHRSVVNDIELAWVEWGVPGDPLVLLTHATGLHARCWTSAVAHLEGYHVLAMDLRGHGQSGQQPPFDWSQFGADLTAFITNLGLTDINGAGHSMGAHCLLQAAANEPDRFRCLSLFDPVIYPPSVYETGVSFDDDKNPAARRRSNWGSPQEMFDKFKDREPFSNWVPAALRDYCDYGLVEHGGSYELACPPQIEAAIYPLATRANIIDRLGRIECPVQVVRAEPRDMAKPVEDFLMSPTRPDLASQFVRGEDIYLPQYSHFMPMENPALAASIIRRDWQPELAS